MPLGFRAAARTQRTTRPSLQTPAVIAPPPDPDPPPIGGSGGGTAPTAPSDITAGLAANNPILHGNGGVFAQVLGASQMATLASMGFRGIIFMMDGIPTFGGSAAFTNDPTATFNAADGRTQDYWKWQKAMMITLHTVANAHANGLKVYFGAHLANQGATLNNGYILPDLFNDALWTSYVSAVTTFYSAGKMMGFDGITFDMEPIGYNPGVFQDWRWDYAGNTHTHAETTAKLNQRMLQLATPLWAAFPNAEIIQYQDTSNDVVPYGYNFLIHNIPDGPDTGSPFDGAAGFIYGLTSVAGWSSWNLSEAVYYKSGADDYSKAQQYNIGKFYAWASRNLPNPSLQLPRFKNSMDIWFDQGDVSQGETNQSAAQAMNLATWARAGATGNNFIVYQQQLLTATYQPDTASYASHGWTAALQAGAAAGTISTTPPTLSASVSTSGTTRTITGTAAHQKGIVWVRAYVYPNANAPVYARMTWNAGGGTLAAGYNNAFQSYSITLTGITGGYAVVTAHSALGQEHSVVVSIGGGGGTIPFRLYSDTSLWNTTKSGLTFDADADATLAGLTYGINNGAFCHPFYRGVSTDPTWTVTATEDHWGHGPRTVTIKAPVPMAHASGSDGVLTVLDSTTGTLWDMYGVAAIDNTAHTITTPMLVDSDGAGSGFGNQQTFASVGTAAIGIAQASGTILATDVNNGIIPHGLFMAFDSSVEGGVNTSGTTAVAPAVANDNGNSGPLPQGGLMVAQGSEPVGLNAMEHQLWLACTTYGVYICDQLGGHPQFYGDGSTLVDNAFTDAGLTAIGRKLRLVRTSW